MAKIQPLNPAYASLIAELILDESIRNFQKEHLYKKIDLALESNDEGSFIALTTQLKLLQSSSQQ